MSSWWLARPSESKLWISLPLGYTFLLQALTGIPQPATLQEINAHEFFRALSSELFSYPFWLQDLSHLPLFFIFAWIWTWYLGSSERSISILKNRALQISLAYAFLNEATQYFVPMRFPSLGDLIMNFAGVLIGTSFHAFFSQRIIGRKEAK